MTTCPSAVKAAKRWAMEHEQQKFTYPHRIQQAIVRAICKSAVRTAPKPEQYAEQYLSKYFVNVTALETWIVTRYIKDSTAWLQIRVGEPHGEQVVQIAIENCREGYLEMLESMEL